MYNSTVRYVPAVVAVAVVVGGLAVILAAAAAAAESIQREGAIRQKLMLDGETNRRRISSSRGHDRNLQ